MGTMIFYGPISERSNWYSEPVFTIVIQTIEELETLKIRYLDHHTFVIPTSPQAKTGQWKHLHFVLPNGKDFETCARIGSVISTPGKSHAFSLFHLDLLTTEQIGTIKQVIISHRYASIPDDFTAINEESVFSLELSKDIAKLYDPPSSELSIESSHPVLDSSPPTAAKTFRTEDFDLPTPPEDTRTVLSAPQAAESQSFSEQQTMIRALLARNAPSDEKLADVALPDEAKALALTPDTSSNFSDFENATEARQNILAFLIFFTKAVQRSGYYADPKHPETRKARRGLYAFFRKMLQNRMSISFVRRGQSQSEDLLIEGLTKQMISARETMPLGAIEMYMPKFLEYLNRRCLLSFSIKRTINEAKFDRFIDLLSEYNPNQANALQEGEQFSRMLNENEIYEVKVIFDEEFIASNRNLPWQAELTLSRLRKDLKVIPLLRQATEEELQQIKLQIFKDTLYPLSNPSFLLAVLLNADLVMQELKEKMGFEERDVERGLVDSIDPEILTSFSHKLIDRSHTLDEQLDKEQRTSRKQALHREKNAMTGILEHLVQRLGKQENPEADATLELLFNEKLVLFDVLPLRLQEGVKDLKRAEAFIVQPDKHLAKFDNPSEDFELLEEVRFLRRMIPHLYREGEYDLIHRIVDIAQRHMETGNTFTQDNTRKLFEYLAGKAVLAQLRNGFDPQNRDRCRSIAALLVSLKEYAVPWLLDVLNNHDNRWVRKLLVDSLVEIGSIAIPFLHSELSNKENSWYFLRNCLVILSKTGKNESFNRIRSLLNHSNAIVRREALKAMIAIEPQFCENDSIDALNDEDKTVKMTALNYLAKAKSSKTELLRYYLSVLDEQSDKDDTDILVKTLQAISRLENIDEGMRTHFELSISRRLAAMYKTKWSGIFVKSSDETVQKIKSNLCVALGTLGNRKETIALLKRAAKDKNADVASRAQQALAHIKA